MLCALFLAPVQLTVGNLVVMAGSAHYSAASSSGSATDAALIAGPVGAVVFLLIVAIIIFFVVSKKNQKRHTKEMDMLLHQMDSIEANVASECKTGTAANELTSPMLMLCRHLLRVLTTLQGL